MKKQLLLTLSLMLLVAGSALCIGIRSDSPATVISAPSLDTSATFRDGLFQGRQSAQRNARRRAPVGRWSTKTDRAVFTTGFEEAYRSLILNELAREISH